MHQKFTPAEMERFFPLESSDKKMQDYPRAQTLNFIKQFACAYHLEGEIPLPLASVILN